MIEGEERSRAPPPSDQVSQPIITMLKNFSCTDKHDMAVFFNLFQNLRRLYSSPVWRRHQRVGSEMTSSYAQRSCAIQEWKICIMPILTVTWILHVLVSFIDLLINWLSHFGVGLKEISWLNFCCNGRQHQFLFFFEKIDSADCLILYFLLKAAMDTQEGEGQQPADPQPADPAVEEQGMEHWPLT